MALRSQSNSSTRAAPSQRTAVTYPKYIFEGVVCHALFVPQARQRSNEFKSCTTLRSFARLRLSIRFRVSSCLFAQAPGCRRAICFLIFFAFSLARRLRSERAFFSSASCRSLFARRCSFSSICLLARVARLAVRLPARPSDRPSDRASAREPALLDCARSSAGCPSARPSDCATVCSSIRRAARFPISR